LGCYSSAGLPFISCCSYREAPLAEAAQNMSDRQPPPDGIVPEEEIARTENRWLIIMLGMLAIMMGIVVGTGITNALH
jgi:hypothetical protein